MLFGVCALFSSKHAEHDVQPTLTQVTLGSQAGHRAKCMSSRCWPGASYSWLRLCPSLQDSGGHTVLGLINPLLVRARSDGLQYGPPWSVLRPAQCHGTVFADLAVGWTATALPLWQCSRGHSMCFQLAAAAADSSQPHSSQTAS